MIPLHNPSDALRPTAIALGSFDGLHRGHRRVIAAVVPPQAAPDLLSSSDQATRAKVHPELIPTVVSFWPHPREVLHG
ncbi:MAG: hypothetical protein WCH37_04835, partial [Synechococcaceae cyanobacterium ELA182]